jgi:Tc toxin complex TcA C-terminal TcB-binding domain
MTNFAKIRTRAEGFHNYLLSELAIRPEQGLTVTESRQFIVQERTIGYRFYLHQHPYVQRLTQRLLRKGVSGLQAADTEYNTRVRIVNPTSARDASGASVALSVGEIIILPDGITVEMGVGTVQFVRNLGIGLSDGLPVHLVRGNTVTINGKASIRRASGESLTLAAVAITSLVDDGPQPALFAEIFGPSRYGPTAMVRRPHPVKDLDFSASGAYAVYNWELFFHVPITIALHLSKNQRFAEALNWFHYLFDPTDDSNGSTPERFWKVRPFQTTDVRKIEEILVNLSTGADPALRDETIRSIEAWKHAPFRPHVIARYRQQAYMYKTLMAYLDNLIAWGDSLFRQDTGEAIDEAMALYVLAANILGPRPLPVPKKGSVRVQNYANLRKDLQQFGTVVRDVEADIAFDLAPFPMADDGDQNSLVSLRSIGKSLYFCVPRNDKLLSYWDTVADRLFKIRNSLNFKGIFRQLALFEPPIDPALLARAAAGGLDVGAIINGLNQPLPLIRFQLLVQKAGEICQEVKSLGNGLLSAMEKEDGEAMALLRARQERVLLDLIEHVKYAQLQDAIKSKEGLMQSLALAVQRYTYYERQLGRKVDDIEKSIPEFAELDMEALAKMKFAMKEPEVALRDVDVDIASGSAAQAAQALNGGKLLSSHEVRESLLLEAAQLSSDVANILSFAGSIAHLFPTAKVHAQPMGVGATVEYGGKNVGDGFGAGSTAARAIAERLNFEARRAGRIDSFARRERDWAFQSNMAAGEIAQVFKQIRGAEIRIAVSELELKNHRQQMKHAQETESFLNGEGADKNGKKTNKSLYLWMKREVKGLYGQYFQLAFDIAKKAERAMQHELGDPDLGYLQFGYLSGKEGLLAGEKLLFDVKRMEMAYHEFNQREYELTRHVSLLQVSPLALVRLRNTGRCTVTLPESMFDMDTPGHYFRRIKTVAVSIPCVTGPYASVSCKLTLLRSSIRKTPLLRDGVYAREDSEDDRFSDYFSSLQSIVTSGAQNDSGMFETNLRDERYLPFENSGVLSEWQLELPANPGKGEPTLFDYQTISDVLLHIRYTAREGGALLRKGAIDRIKELIDAAQAVGSVRLFSIRNEFPTEWARFQAQSPAANQRFALELELRNEHYPLVSTGRLNSVVTTEIFANSAKTPAPSALEVCDKADKNDASAKKDALVKDASLGQLLVGKLVNIVLPTQPVPLKPVGKLTLFFDTREMNDLWIAITWSGAAS